MGKSEVKVERYTIKQRGGKSPDIQVTRTIYPPVSSGAIPDELTREQFHDILKKASEPKKPESD